MNILNEILTVFMTGLKIALVVSLFVAACFGLVLLLMLLATHFMPIGPIAAAIIFVFIIGYAYKDK